MDIEAAGQFVKPFRMIYQSYDLILKQKNRLFNKFNHLVQKKDLPREPAWLHRAFATDQYPTIIKHQLS